MLDICIRRLVGDLRSWLPGNAPTDRWITDLTLSMLGDRKDFTPENFRHSGDILKCKAGEVGTLLEFSLHMLKKHGGTARYGRSFIVAGESMSQFLQIVRDCPGPVMSEPQRAALMNCACLHVRACKQSGVHCVPKHHLTLHLADRTRTLNLHSTNP
eukprot:9220047-Pyramimonas_sp.AAC.1